MVLDACLNPEALKTARRKLFTLLSWPNDEQLIVNDTGKTGGYVACLSGFCDEANVPKKPQNPMCLS